MVWKTWESLVKLFPEEGAALIEFPKRLLKNVLVSTRDVQLFLIRSGIVRHRDKDNECTDGGSPRHREFAHSACYALFANNSEIGAKWRKNDIRWIVYKRCLPCFTNRVFTVRRICIGVVVSSTNTKYFFVKKKLSAARKLMANNKPCTATRSYRFRWQYFIRWKNNFVPYSSCLRIVYSGLSNSKDEFGDFGDGWAVGLLNTRARLAPAS